MLRKIRNCTGCFPVDPKPEDPNNPDPDGCNCGDLEDRLAAVEKAINDAVECS
jgi:hypothetical protein